MSSKKNKGKSQSEIVVWYTEDNKGKGKKRF